MKIGIISDTHDNMPNITTAVQLLQKQGAEHLLHAGDYVAPFSVHALFKLKGDMPFIGVLGNCDGELIGLSEAAHEQIYPGAHTFELVGKRFFMVHDLDRCDLDAVTKDHDYIIHGHTHEAQAKTVNQALVINPGECCGIVTGLATCALLDTETNAVEILRID